MTNQSRRYMRPCVWHCVYVCVCVCYNKHQTRFGWFDIRLMRTTIFCLNGELCKCWVLKTLCLQNLFMQTIRILTYQLNWLNFHSHHRWRNTSVKMNSHLRTDCVLIYGKMRFKMEQPKNTRYELNHLNGQHIHISMWFNIHPRQRAMFYTSAARKPFSHLKPSHSMDNTVSNTVSNTHRTHDGHCDFD